MVILELAYTVPAKYPHRDVLDVTGRLVAMALVISYVAGLFLLPVYWVFEGFGWRGWRSYVPTAAVAGLVTGLVMVYGDPSSPPWTYYAMFSASGASCAAIFSMILAARRQR